MMKAFLSEDFLLQTETAKALYFGHAEKMPIIDYHNHLPPDEIAEDKQFENLTRIWLNGDHYKWRAMRANGVEEKYITGNTTDWEKFEKWAATVPFTIKNPLYHWTHMELKNPFAVAGKVLNSETAREIYENCGEKLRSKDFSVKNILRKMNVKVLCTTDDPADSLEHHLKLKRDGFEIKVFPTFRPDRAMAIEDPVLFNTYLKKLSEVSDTEISSFDQLIKALKNRHDFFAEAGCKLSDHGLETFYAENYTLSEIEKIFSDTLKSKVPASAEVVKFKSAVLFHLAVMDHEKGWTQQFHVGAIRNNNIRLKQLLGADAGVDSIGDFEMAKPMSAFLDKLDRENKLTKTILYNLNPRDNELFATMAGNFNDGTVPGKMQYGSAWWFLDQKEGMEKQLNALGNMGLLSRFIGMITDSRSFLSYSRHEYFRRILCNLIGNDVENGEIPADMELLGKMVENICYYNAKEYFKFDR